MTQAERNKRNRVLQKRRVKAKQEHDEELKRLIERLHTLMTQSVLSLNTTGKLEDHLCDVYQGVCEIHRHVVKGPPPVDTDHGSPKPPTPESPPLPWDKLVQHWDPSVDLDVANLLPSDLFDVDHPLLDNAAPPFPDSLPPIPDLDIPPFISSHESN